MTSEVALMNKSAVALAADSAATVTYWDADKAQTEQRYFKRANKIFNMVSGRPVGLMTYQSGSLQGMPWEVLLKAYRDDRRGAAQDQLQNYAIDFFDYVASNREIFPLDDQESFLIETMVETAERFAVALILADNVEAEADDSKKVILITSLLDDAEKNLASENFINTTAEEIYSEINKNNTEEIINEFRKADFAKMFLGLVGEAIFRRVVATAVQAMFKNNAAPLEYTGIVVAGYGETQFLPQLEHYKVYGLYKNKLIYTRLDTECKKIAANNLSEIVPIAQSKMINTFRLGADLRTLEAVEEHLGIALNQFADGLRKAGHLPKNVNTEPIAAQAALDFKGRVRDYIGREHGRPLRRVIGMLSPEELAELAETFVSIESLKERVTSPTETVSGPIDVAVITKGDGFIWIKRKHYFDPELNLRFVARKQREVKE